MAGFKWYELALLACYGIAAIVLARMIWKLRSDHSEGP
jgi:hypothetical protein